jgi:SAM-dependent methyltransferase
MAGAVVNMALVSEEFDQAATSRREAVEYWESQYAGQPRRWSGRVNPTMAEVVMSLPPGPDRTALDLGCGEGGDAVWLAEQGWQVTAVDISATATGRGAEGAASRGLADRITWISQDLATWTTEQTFDLVAASFFHSTVELPRTEILRRAARLVLPGGHLLIVSHVFETEDDIPPWSRRWLADQGGHDHMHDLLMTPAGEIAELALEGSEWEIVTQEIRRRQATGPDGRETATIKDGVVLLRRRNARGAAQLHQAR